MSLKNLKISTDEFIEMYRKKTNREIRKELNITEYSFYILVHSLNLEKKRQGRKANQFKFVNDEKIIMNEKK